MATNQTGRAARRRRKPAGGCVIVTSAAASVCLLLSPAAAQAAPSATHLGTAVEIGQPPNTASGFNWLLAVACSRAGSCTAGGLWQAPSVSQAMAVTESSRHWGTPHTVVMPPDAPGDPQAEILGVACTGPGNCVAVGNYFVGQSQAFVAIQSHGAWARARRIALPADSATVSVSILSSVACTSLGSCVAVGQYKDDFGHLRAMAIAESNGKWRQAVRLRLPVNAGLDPKASLSSVSCVKAGTCRAVGGYADTGGNSQAFVISQSGGKWQRGAEIRLPANAATNPLAGMASVSCAPGGPCVAVGSYRNNLAVAEPMVVTRSSGGLWQARPLTLVPAGAAAQPASFLLSVACPKAGGCIAAGTYKQSSGISAAMVLTESAGKWTSAARIHLPSDAATTVSQDAQARGTTCTSTGFCAVVGLFHTATTDRGFAANTL